MPFRKILMELRELTKRNKSKVDPDVSEVLRQMASYLDKHQQIIDFVLAKNNHSSEKEMSEIALLYQNLANANSPPVPHRANYVPLTTEANPVYCLTKSLETVKAELSFIPANASKSAYYRLGALNNVSTTNFQTLDEGYSTLLGSTQQLRVVSNSASDTLSGTGVQRVLIGGIAANGQRILESVTLNGTTGVLTVNNFQDIDFLNSSQIGSNNAAVGTVSVTDTAGTTTYGAIAPNFNSWRSGRFFTGNYIAAYICAWSISSYNAASRVELRTTQIAGNKNALIARALGLSNNDTTTFSFPIPIKVVKSGLVSIRALAKGAQNEVTSHYHLYVREE